MKWINLLGLTLQFLSFWFAAPELLGQSTMQRFEKGLKKLVSAIPLLVILIFVLSYALATAGYGIYKGLKGAEHGLEENELMNYFITMGVVFSFYFVFLFFAKRIRKMLEDRVATPLIDKLINQGEVRKQALIIGAILFSIGFFMQAVSIIVT